MTRAVQFRQHLHTLVAIELFLRAVLCNRDGVQQGAGEEENNDGAVEHDARIGAQKVPHARDHRAIHRA